MSTNPTPSRPLGEPARIRTGLRVSQLPAALAARVDQLLPGQTLRLTAMTRTTELGSADVRGPEASDSLATRDALVADTLGRLQIAVGIPLSDDGETTVQFRTPVQGVDLQRFAWHLDADELDALIRYDHWIPLSHGVSHAYLDEHLPGLSWAEIDRLLQSADLRWITPSRPTDRSVPMLARRANACAVHFNSPDDWAAQWSDRWVTAAPQRQG
ncbi:hypothetical protein [Pseudoclavibacter soli]|jgi:hypothetical protein|uniref:hypothetical protein n=1 Tax=Pseudoclavibacter soli TaxID=452623 RepID=UPI0004297803|nr:hypothetical protein [Pseudoclavibacter soli]